MTQPFTPKFVDMVRVNSSTLGTGPLVCGPAVAGFASFAEALSAGDSFYYSVQGVERPQEREIGRGTYQANNTITRQPLRGPLTDFSSGTKTIALVAASEWYSRLQEAAAQPSVQAVATRAALKAVPAPARGDVRALTEGGRAGDFQWDPAIPVATHQADTAEGVYVAPSQTAAGAWVRRFSGAVDVRWFGAVADDATDCRPALLAALAYLKSAGIGSGPTQRGSGAIVFPVGRFFCSAAVNIYQRVTIRGQGSGLQAAPATVIRWPANSCGFIVQSYNTVGVTATTTDTFERGNGTIIQGLTLLGGFSAGISEGDFHAVVLRDRAELDCVFQNWQGDGVYVSAATNNGNANGFRVSGTAINCRDGLNIGQIHQSETNAGASYVFDASLCRRWGIRDNSFLGCTHYSPHAAACGFGPNRGVVHLGRSFSVVLGQEAGAATNAPPSVPASNHWWNFVGNWAQPGWPAWTSGMAVPEPGGSYYLTGCGGNSVSKLIDPYIEGSQPPAYVMSPSMAYGKTKDMDVRGTGPVLEAMLGALSCNTTIASRIMSPDGATVSQARIGGDINTPMIWGGTRTGFANEVNYRFSGRDVVGGIGFGASGVSVLWTGLDTNFHFGSNASMPNVQAHLRGLVVGDGGDDANGNGRRIRFGTAAPTSGSGARGEIVFNRDHGAAAPFGWRCIAQGNGNGGTWLPVFGLSAGPQNAIANAALPDATDLATANALVNELKAKVNAVLAALRTVNVLAT